MNPVSFSKVFVSGTNFGSNDFRQKLLLHFDLKKYDLVVKIHNFQKYKYGNTLYTDFLGGIMIFLKHVFFLSR
jgi:hypothetical protein